MEMSQSELEPTTTVRDTGGKDAIDSEFYQKSPRIEGNECMERVGRAMDLNVLVRDT